MGLLLFGLLVRMGRPILPLMVVTDVVVFAGDVVLLLFTMSPAVEAFAGECDL